jgi:hypothetical protein
MARVVAVWCVGGVCLDVLDSVVEKPLGELLSAGLLVAEGPPSAPVEADFLGASAGGPRLLELLKLQSTRVQSYKPSNCPSHRVMLATGPKAWGQWAEDVGVKALPLTKRFHREKSRNAEPLWASSLDADCPCVVVHHASSWMGKRKPLDRVVAPPKKRAPRKVRKGFNTLPSGSARPLTRGVAAASGPPSVRATKVEDLA